jgi:hypothetical protein
MVEKESTQQIVFKDFVASPNGLNKIKAAMSSAIMSEVDFYMGGLILSRIAKIPSVVVTKDPILGFPYIDIKKIKFNELNECKKQICEDMRKYIEKLIGVK